MPLIIIGLAVVAALFALNRQQSDPAFVQTQALVDADEYFRKSTLKSWNLHDPAGWASNEKACLSACQAFLDKWYGIGVTSVNLKEFLADRRAVWRASGNGFIPVIQALSVAKNPRITSATGPSASLIWKTAKIKFPFPEYVQGKYLADFAVTAVRGPLSWDIVLMANQAGSPDWYNPASAASRISQQQFVARLDALCKQAFSGGA